MTKTTGLLAAATVALFTIGAAGAAPLAPAPLGDASPLVQSPLVQVRGGCGFGEHRGPYGGCRLNRGPRGAIRRALDGPPRGCPPGRRRIRGICRPVY